LARYEQFLAVHEEIQQLLPREDRREDEFVVTDTLEIFNRFKKQMQRWLSKRLPRESSPMHLTASRDKIPVSKSRAKCYPDNSSVQKGESSKHHVF
jgi:hypothetical protein